MTWKSHVKFYRGSGRAIGKNITRERKAEQSGERERERERAKAGERHRERGLERLDRRRVQIFDTLIRTLCLSNLVAALRHGLALSNLFAEVCHELAVSNSFGAVGRGFAFSNSFGAFRFQLLRFSNSFRDICSRCPGMSREVFGGK